MSQLKKNIRLPRLLHLLRPSIQHCPVSTSGLLSILDPSLPSISLGRYRWFIVFANRRSWTPLLCLHARPVRLHARPARSQGRPKKKYTLGWTGCRPKFGQPSTSCCPFENPANERSRTRPPSHQVIWNAAEQAESDTIHVALVATAHKTQQNRK